MATLGKKQSKNKASKVKKTASALQPAKSLTTKVKVVKAIANSVPAATPIRGAASVDKMKRELLRRRDQIMIFQHAMEEHGTTSHDEPGDLVDRSEEVEQWMKRESMNQHVSDELRHIDAALQRMEAGDFGVCESCDEPIPMNRLRAKPDATFCLPCQEMNERRSSTAMSRRAALSF